MPHVRDHILDSGISALYNERLIAATAGPRWERGNSARAIVLGESCATS